MTILRRPIKRELPERIAHRQMVVVSSGFCPAPRETFADRMGHHMGEYLLEGR